MTRTAFLVVGLFLFSLAGADEETAEVTEADDAETAQPPITVEVATRRNDEAALKENPEEQRRARNDIKEEVIRTTGQTPVEDASDFSAEFYLSLRAVVINTRDENGDRESRLSDGYSRGGMRLGWEFTDTWEMYGRAEYGVDVVDNFATRGGFDEAGGPVKRVVVIGVDHEHFAASYGKNWGVYYEVSGMTDRFALFGGSAAGNYNAGTDGSAT